MYSSKHPIYSIRDRNNISVRVYIAGMCLGNNNRGFWVSSIYYSPQEKYTLVGIKDNTSIYSTLSAAILTSLRTIIPRHKITIYSTNSYYNSNFSKHLEKLKSNDWINRFHRQSTTLKDIYTLSEEHIDVKYEYVRNNYHDGEFNEIKKILKALYLTDSKQI